MNLLEVKVCVKKSLERLNKQDYFLMRDDISERAIAHQFARKLSHNFRAYHVDCEYNGNIFSENSSKRKEIDILNYRLRELNRNRYDNELPDESLINLSVTPDIIIHRRRTNEQNLLIIEIKKSTNNSIIDLNFDKEKVKIYTEREGLIGSTSNFNYEFGLLLIVGCAQNHTDELIWYENGIITDCERILNRRNS